MSAEPMAVLTSALRRERGRRAGRALAWPRRLHGLRAGAGRRVPCGRGTRSAVALRCASAFRLLLAQGISFFDIHFYTVFHHFL